jgi:hypothetical protein
MTEMAIIREIAVVEIAVVGVGTIVVQPDERDPAGRQTS